jgi:hypothetical protein
MQMLQAAVHRNPGITVHRELVRAEAVHHMQHAGFVQIPYDPTVLVTHVPRIVDGMRRMTNGDDKSRFEKRVLFVDEAGYDHDSGLIRREERERKWFYHLYARTEEDFRALGAPVSKYQDFFTSVSILNDRAFEIATTFAQLWDATHGRSVLLSERLDTHCVVTRVLRYLPRERGQPDATVHIDRSCLTVHWWSSRAGLNVFSPDKEGHQILETQHDHVCLFPGMKFAAITKGAFGSGTPHGVRDDARDQEGVEDRFAIVSFIHCRLTPKEARWLKLHKKAFDALEQTCVM